MQSFTCARDVIVAREKLALGKGGDVVHFVIDTEAGKLVRADGVIPTDSSLCIVARTTEKFPDDTAPDPALTDVGAEEIVGRAVDADGKPIPGVLAAFPTHRWAPADTVQALSGDDGVFRLPMLPQNRYAYLTLSKAGWGPVFLTDVPVGAGFRVTLQNTTRLRGTMGGEHPGRVELLLEKNKFTRRADSFDHQVRDIQFRTATDDQGVYDFPMEVGQYRWTATSADGRFARGEISLGAGETRDLGASLRRGFDVVLELHDMQTGQPVPGIEVCILDREGFATIANRPGSERTSDADGRLRWENLPPGETQFEAWGLRPFPGRKQSAYARWWLDDQSPATPATHRSAGRDGLDSLRVTVGDGTPASVRIRVERGDCSRFRARQHDRRQPVEHTHGCERQLPGLPARRERSGLPALRILRTLDRGCSRCQRRERTVQLPAGRRADLSSRHGQGWLLHRSDHRRRRQPRHGF